MVPARSGFTACINLFAITANKVVIVCKLACLVLLARGGEERGGEGEEGAGMEKGGGWEEEREA